MLLLLTLAPLAYLISIVALLLTGYLSGPSIDISEGHGVLILLLHITMMFLSSGLIVFHIASIVRNPHLDTNGKIIWGVVIFQFNLFAMPFYWYRHLWRSQPETAP